MRTDSDSSSSGLRRALTSIQMVIALFSLVLLAFIILTGQTQGAFIGAGLVALAAGGAVVILQRAKPRETTPSPPDPSELESLTASRREIVDAFEIERRRIERDLHDGAQQFLVATSMKMGEAAMLLEAGKVEPARALLGEAQDAADRALSALRRTVTGINPAVLTDRGLEAAIRDLAALSPNVTVRCPHPLPSLPDGVATAVYFLTSEALTNAAKHAPGAPVSVLVAADDTLHVTVVDEGPGGAVVKSGHGLAGIRERIAAFGGSVEVSSPEGGPTVVAARVPLLLYRGEGAVVLEEDA